MFVSKIKSGEVKTREPPAQPKKQNSARVPNKEKRASESVQVYKQFG